LLKCSRFTLFALEYWIVALGSWLLALGSWLLALGSWLLALGSWLLLCFVLDMNHVDASSLCLAPMAQIMKWSYEMNETQFMHGRIPGAEEAWLVTKKNVSLDC
jgi:hypothetical protein